MDSRRNSRRHDGDAVTRWESSHDYPSHSSGTRLNSPRDIEPLQVEDCIRRKEAFSHVVTRARWRCVRDGHKTLTSYTPLLQTPQSVQKKSAPPTNFNSKLGGVMQQASRTWYPTSGASPDQYSSVSKPLLPLQLPECSQTLLLLQAESKMHS